MNQAPAWPRLSSAAAWRDVVWPREQGSWSLALEPLAFGLIAAPSLAGVGLALAVVAAFFARRPLRVVGGKPRNERAAVARLALVACGGVAVLALGVAVLLRGVTWFPWLVPPALGGAVFLVFDVRNAGRETVAEVAGAAAFAAVPAALATLAGWSPPAAGALALVMLGRAVPTVLCVRAVLRPTKTGKPCRAPALVATGVALGGGIALVAAGLAPRMVTLALAVLTGRTVALLVYPRPRLRARTLGLIEALLGLAFVIVVAVGWRA